MSLSTVVVSAAGAAAPIDDGAALRPTLSPEAPSRILDHLPRAGPAPPKPVFAFPAGGEGRRSGAVLADPVDAPAPPADPPAEPPDWSVAPFDDAPPAPLADFDAYAGRTLGANLPATLQIFAAGARPPSWLGAATAYDFARRQIGGGRLERSSWRGGWEIDFAPTGSTLAYARGFGSESTRRTLYEGKLGLAPFGDLSFASQPFAKIYVGPFAVLGGLRLDEDAKLGLHVTFGQVGVFHLGLAGGYARGRFGAGGAFGLLESSFRF